MVMQGKLKYPGYIDGDVIRSVTDGSTLARKSSSGAWYPPVKEARPKHGRWDDVKPIGPAVQVQLTKGEFY